MNGTSVGAVDISDSLTDAANEVVFDLLAANFQTKGGVRLANARITKLVQKALQMASILDGLKENFSECIYETATIKAEADSILIAKTPEKYFLIRQANRLIYTPETRAIKSWGLTLKSIIPLYKSIGNHG